MTVLKCQAEYKAAKIHTTKPDGSPCTKEYKAGTYFSPRSITVHDIYDLHSKLKELEICPDKFVIRGELNPALDPTERSLVRRMCHPRPAEGIDTPPFIEQPRYWVMLDFDKVDNPLGLDPGSAEAMAHLRSLLPPEFRDVTCSYNLSASAGLSGSKFISGHLWFWLDRAIGSRELKAWLQSYPVDLQLFNPVQPHYIARPIFEGGRVDPVGKRKGIIPGTRDQVTVPEIDLSKPRDAIGAGANGGLNAARGYEAKMALLGDGEGRKGCHNVITPAIAAYISEHGPNADRAALKADIRRRAAEAPWDYSKHPKEYIDRETSDEVLDRSIRDWVDKSITIAQLPPPAEQLSLETARKKIRRAKDGWFADAMRWHKAADYRRARQNGTLELVRAPDGTVRLRYDAQSNAPPW